MKVKCYLAEGNDADRNMMDLLRLTRSNGQQGLGGLVNGRDGISLAKNKGALVLVGGRESIMHSLIFSGGIPLITGGNPFRVTFARKHKVFGKNETCVKIVGSEGHPQPEDGSEYVALSGQGPTITCTPVQLGWELNRLYGWDAA